MAKVARTDEQKAQDAKHLEAAQKAKAKGELYKYKETVTDAKGITHQVTLIHPLTANLAGLLLVMSESEIAKRAVERRNAIAILKAKKGEDSVVKDAFAEKQMDPVVMAKTAEMAKSLGLTVEEVIAKFLS